MKLLATFRAGTMNGIDRPTLLRIKIQRARQKHDRLRAEGRHTESSQQWLIVLELEHAIAKGERAL